MTIWQQVKQNIQSFLRGTPRGLDLPENGRSSLETTNGLNSSLAGYNNLFAQISPIIDFEMLTTLKHLWLYNPDFSQYVQNIINLANPGHTLLITAANPATVELAMRRLNDAAARLYPSAGVDGLINAYLAQLAWAGAVSSEDVVDLRAKTVDRVVLVPVEQIRFIYDRESGEYKPYQRAYNAAAAASVASRPLGLIPLNTETYHYFPFQTVENSPYAKPPATAAVNAILEVQQPAMDNVKFIAKKLGILGLVSVSVTPPSKRGNESDEEFNRRAASYLGRVKNALDGNFSNGLLVAYRDQKIEHTNVTAGAQGFYDIFRVGEEQVMSGLGMQPAFFGRTDSTTETYADVVYNLLLAQVGNFQRVARRRHESTMRLDLRLAGIEVETVAMNFNKAHARNPLQEAQAEQIRQTVILEKAQTGIISPDEAAHALGYENAFDPTLLGAAPKTGAPMNQSQTVNLSFNRQTGRYEFQRERLQLATNDEGQRTADNLVSFPKKKLASSNGA